VLKTFFCAILVNGLLSLLASLVDAAVFSAVVLAALEKEVLSATRTRVGVFCFHLDEITRHTVSMECVFAILVQGPHDGFSLAIFLQTNGTQIGYR
jgi:hypothetical protein